MRFSPSVAALAIWASEAAADALTRPAGFAYAEGENFMVDGKPFRFAGSNAYWLPFINSPADVERSIQESKRAGQKVIRTWGFNEKNVTFIPGGLPMYGGDSSVYFQSWENGTATVNTGATGLQVLDNVVRLAEANDMKLLIALTNNWSDYGGMDVYTVNLGFPYHDDFYREPKIKAAYKNYAAAVINRYKNSSAIFAWELANEPRCSADKTKGLPRSANCTFDTTSAWYQEMGAFVKSIDPHHMVTWGGEGEFYEEGATDGFYTGSEGGHFYHELALPEMDFGTFHLLASAT
ncbi:cellulase [Diplocarpon rosae]|nr:cellulase [Diplocarpon rosae]